jgi:uncharacterized protein YbgA (DUF1722 family)/uncharacterized protein YbbK (DUF523 family)
MTEFAIPNVVISRCITFDPCRWNGQMISSEPVEKMKKYINFITTCPESEIGLGVPRNPIRIVMNDEEQALIQSVTGIDVSKKMKSFTDGFLKSLRDVDGFILKEKSPSCGTKEVKIYSSLGKVSPISGKSSGFFGTEVLERFADMPIENEGRLLNLNIREHFFTRIFSLAYFRQIRKTGGINSLVIFHSQMKLILMAYNQSVMRIMGRITANREKKSEIDIMNEYEKNLKKAIANLPRLGSIINVLMHSLGYFSDKISSAEKQHFISMLEKYRKKKIPLSACTSILRSWIVRFDEKYLASQRFFTPFPDEMIDLRDSSKGI